MLLNRPQTNIRPFLFLVGTESKTVFVSVDAVLNAASVCRELPAGQVLRMWTGENVLKLDTLHAVVCGDTSASVRVILTNYMKPASSHALRSTKRLSP